LDPDTGAVRVVATDFDKCNGIAFTGDGKTAYMFVSIFFFSSPSLADLFAGRADTGASGGFLGNNQTEPATM
jgi:gluconolactonase